MVLLGIGGGDGAGTAAGEVVGSEIVNDVGGEGGGVRMTETKVEGWLVGDEENGPITDEVRGVDAASGEEGVTTNDGVIGIEAVDDEDGKRGALVEMMGSTFEAGEHSPYLG